MSHWWYSNFWNVSIIVWFEGLCSLLTIRWIRYWIMNPFLGRNLSLVSSYFYKLISNIDIDPWFKKRKIDDIKRNLIGIMLRYNDLILIIECYAKSIILVRF